MRMPMFGFLVLGFLLIAVVLAIACYLVFRSGEPGKTKLSGCAGCAIGFGLLSLAGIGALGCTAIAFIDAGNEAVRHGPIKSFEWRWPRDRHEHDEDAGEWDEGTDESSGDESSAGESDDSHALKLRVVVRGSADYSVAGQISRWLQEHTDGDITVSTRVRIENGDETTELEFGLPLSREEIEDIREDLERDAAGFELPEGVRVEIKDPHDD
jgi:hypothetical protein